jgi:small membrane protein
MMIQIFLTVFLVAIAALFAVQQATSRLVRASILGVIAVGGFFVWAPDETTVISRALGVGRGADLVLYVWVVISLALMLVLYLKIVQMGRKVTQLTRAIALGQARTPAADQEDESRAL